MRNRITICLVRTLVGLLSIMALVGAARGTPVLAPSGAPVWNTPTVDARRGLLYFGTGENYSSPAQDTSDAIIAMDAATGVIRWSFQATPGDAWNLACMPFIPDHANCPAEQGPDFDFASPPALIEVDGREILVAGQKSGDVWGLDPDTGKLVWHRKAGRGGNQLPTTPGARGPFIDLTNFLITAESVMDTQPSFG